MALPSDRTEHPELDVLEEDDEFDRETERLQKDGRINCPDKIQEILDLQPDDKVDFYYAKDVKNVKTVYVRKHVGGWFSPMKALKEIGLAITIVMLLVPTVVYAQEEPQVVTDPVPAPPTNPDPTVVTVNDLERFRGPNAYIPFVLEMRFPAGVEHIQEVRSISGSSAYTMFDEVNTQPGIVAKRFTTASLDTFTITIGQKYNTPMDQVAEFVIRSGENAEITWSRTLAIKGLDFQQTFEITTMPVPHIPTAEELNAGVYTRLDALTDLVTGSANAVREMSTQRYLESNAIYSTVGINGIIVLIGIGTLIVMFGIKRKLNTKNDGHFTVNNKNPVYSSNSGTVGITISKHTTNKYNQPNSKKRPFWEVRNADPFAREDDLTPSNMLPMKHYEKDALYWETHPNELREVQSRNNGEQGA